MLKLVVLVSGGGTNLQAIIDGIADGSIPNTEIKAVISNNKNAYALQRAKDHNIAAACVSPKDFADRAAFNQALLEKIQSCEPDLIVLAGCLVVIPEIMVDAYPNKIINIHPSLIPAFCGTGYYGLKVHEGVLKRGVKVTGATVHFVDKGTVPVRSSFRRQWKYSRTIPRKFCSGVSWSRQNGKSCRRRSA